MTLLVRGSAIRSRERLVSTLLAGAYVLMACSSDDASTASPASSSGGPTADGGNGSSGSSGHGGSSGGDGSPGSDASGPDSLYRRAVMAQSPVGYWRLGETSGTVAKDEIGNAHPGNYYGGFQLGVPGITADDKAVSFDGTSGCIGVGEYFRFPGRISYSVEAWVNISAYGAEGTRVVSTEGSPTGIRSGWNLSASYGNTGYPYFDSWSSEGTNNQYVMGAYAKVSPEKGQLPLNQWNYLVGTFSDDAEEIWVNGELRDKEKQSSLSHPNQGTLTIGCQGSGNGPIYLGTKGAVDEVAIYDKVLTPAEIKSHYDAGRGM